jgi:hypothetical protein
MREPALCNIVFLSNSAYSVRAIIAEEWQIITDRGCSRLEPLKDAPPGGRICLENCSIVDVSVLGRISENCRPLSGLDAKFRKTDLNVH